MRIRRRPLPSLSDLSSALILSDPSNSSSSQSPSIVQREHPKENALRIGVAQKEKGLHQVGDLQAIDPSFHGNNSKKRDPYISDHSPSALPITTQLPSSCTPLSTIVTTLEKVLKDEKVKEEENGDSTRSGFNQVNTTVKRRGDEGLTKNGKKTRRSPAVLMEGSRCSRVNGRGWRCCQPTLVGYSLCEHHLGKGRLRSMNSSVKGQLGCTEHKRSNTEKGSGEEIARKKSKKIGLVKARSISSLLDERISNCSSDDEK